MTLRNRQKAVLSGLIAALIVLAVPATMAGPLRDRIQERRAALQQQEALEDEEVPETSSAAIPQGVEVVRDVAYGRHERQRFDVYAPPRAQGAPVIFMVHGGGWRRGDKAMPSVVENKVARWVPRGFIVISTNYRLLPQADPLEQARDVARALAVAQEKASDWGGDRTRFVLMGHSAGAHLVALLAASPSLAAEAGAAPWLGSVLLDGATLDVERTMKEPHMRLHDQAFGSDPAYWASVSPYRALSGTIRPVLAVCSTRRADACPQAASFVARANTFHTPASVLEQSLSHRDINLRLGQPGRYTDAVEAFLAALDSSLANVLGTRVAHSR